MTNRPLQLDFRSVDEPQPGNTWRALFRSYWPAYRKWFLRDGDNARPGYEDSVRALQRHMPELVPTFERLVELAGGGPRVARFLSLYCPTPIITGCSQAVWTGDEIALIRNYDYAPDLCDGIVLRSRWTGAPVIALTDCLWGVLDGMNANGLAVALSFGGRNVVGDGFGITLILRYLLETCSTAAEACATLRRVPCSMAYNVSVVDATGEYATAFLAPDRPTVVEQRAVSTNHQTRVEWETHAATCRTVERETRLETLLAEPDQTLEALVDAFLTPPLYRDDYGDGGGTLYTAVYRPATGSASVIWPDHQWRIGVDAFRERTYVVTYEGASARS